VFEDDNLAVFLSSCYVAVATVLCLSSDPELVVPPKKGRTGGRGTVNI